MQPITIITCISLRVLFEFRDTPLSPQISLRGGFRKVVLLYRTTGYMTHVKKYQGSEGKTNFNQYIMQHMTIIK